MADNTLAYRALATGGRASRAPGFTAIVSIENESLMKVPVGHHELISAVPARAGEEPVGFVVHGKNLEGMGNLRSTRELSQRRASEKTGTWQLAGTGPKASSAADAENGTAFSTL